MKIGSRITITTSALVAISLGTYGLITLRARRADLTHDAERQTRELAGVLGPTFESALRQGGFEQLRRTGDLVSQRSKPPFEVDVVLALPSEGAALPGLARRLELLRITQEVVVQQGVAMRAGSEGVAVMAPIRDGNGEIVAVLDVRRQLASIDEAVDAATLRMVVSLVMLTLGLGLAVGLIARRGVTAPLGKLIDGIDGVARGDLSRVILQEREDEIGALAARFNDMTGSLREAREETRRGADAKLELEDRLRQAEKLATIGQLAAGIAHEVGTPLNVIAGRASVMARKAPDEAEVRKNAGIIADQTQRITRIIQQLLDFARRKPSGRDLVDVGRVATSSLDFLEHKLTQGRISAAIAVEPGIPAIPGDGDQVQQICLNLYLNAIQAMPEGGKLAVRVRREHRKKPNLDLAAASSWVVLEVRDTGVGIPPDDRDKIFEPFYSTKAHGEGTGLGLSVSHGIVRDHDGWIELDGAPEGTGTVFRVFLPMETPALRPTTIPPGTMMAPVKPEPEPEPSPEAAPPSPQSGPADPSDAKDVANAR
ncbi:MAG: HAMP domain-containing protein [Deltaproteobacteria bacterium]|nr:HAMP domain-containing protein [Deltaproteobacteria bacterium]